MPFGAAAAGQRRAVGLWAQVVALAGGATVRTVASGLEVPWEIAFLPDGSALVTERPGRVRLLDTDGALREEPVARVDVAAEGEGGLLGLALDPAFEENRFVRIRTAVEGPDGALYLLTSNRDGRGDPVAEDDRILRISPPPAG